MNTDAHNQFQCPNRVLTDDYRVLLELFPVCLSSWILRNFKYRIIQTLVQMMRKTLFRMIEMTGQVQSGRESFEHSKKWGFIAQKQGITGSHCLSIMTFSIYLFVCLFVYIKFIGITL